MSQGTRFARPFHPRYPHAKLFRWRPKAFPIETPPNKSGEGHLHIGGSHRFTSR
ncbi:uncharacterized protein PHALS_09057 [Plasmopara halstedii]|uniref:Uncharacterized protein n=1 Tax=Plasmopara halstedii TaxID=4781 RepID=A0A0P1AEC1_PLAHL|nr:uncharacterized protein PHALS_09057 [Plasmopara halstedii]CEG38992.1 hypothetical protein PHALS_09057 [Plasmopara halstedii]|eukprot:XP_024575361.1 hypothetical protein PHALS_09057 [Plasmopara halstedii]